MRDIRAPSKVTTKTARKAKAACDENESKRYREDPEFRYWENLARQAESPEELERIRWQYEHRRRVL